MNFKWKYIAWLLPFIFIVVRDALTPKNCWCNFPYFFMDIVLFIASIVLVGYCFAEDK